MSLFCDFFCVQTCKSLSLHLCVSCTFSLSLSSVYLFCPILFYYYSLFAYFLRGDINTVVSRENLRGVICEETIIEIYCALKNQFSF